MTRDQVFISYSHADKEWLDRLQTMLAPLKRKGIVIWADTDIDPGKKWKAQIEQALKQAKVAVLLVSPDFLASEFIRDNELPPLLEAAEKEGVSILWVPVRQSLYEITDIVHYQAVCEPDTPLGALTPTQQDAKLKNIAKTLMELPQQPFEEITKIVEPSEPYKEGKGPKIKNDPGSSEGTQLSLPADSAPTIQPSRPGIKVRKRTLIWALVAGLAGLVAGAVLVVLVAAFIPTNVTPLVQFLRGFLEASDPTPPDDTPHVPTFSGVFRYFGDKQESTFGVDLENKLSSRFKEDTKINVETSHFPDESRDRELRDKILGNPRTPYDVVQIDSILVSEYAKSLIDLSPFLKYPFDRDTNIGKLEDRLVAVPFYKDIGLLYYNKELLKKHKIEKPPDTWEELENDVKTIQEEEEQSNIPGNKEFVGFVWQGWHYEKNQDRQEQAQKQHYEGLTCNALEWIASHGGFDKENGRIKSRSAKDAVVDALNRARIWVNGEGKNKPISSESIHYDEDLSLNKFAEGNVAFLRHWPDAYKTLKEKNMSFGIAPLPHAQFKESSGVVGGWHLAVPKNSRNPLEGIEFIRYLISKDVQEWRASKGFYLPIRDDAKLPDWTGWDNVKSKTQSIIRPSNRIIEYTEASKCFSDKVAEILKSHSKEDVIKIVESMASVKDCKEFME